MQKNIFKLIFQKNTKILNRPVLQTVIVYYDNGSVTMKGDTDLVIGQHEAYPPATINCAREILEDYGFKEIDTLENLRAFIKSGPFQVSKIEADLGLTKGVVSQFLHKTYTDKQNNVLKTGLGVHEEKVFEYMKSYGYNETIAYQQFL